MRKHQVWVRADNDALAFTHFDRYYTHGMFLGYNYQASVQHRFNFLLGQKIYTPELYTVDQVEYYDRPYAGVLFGKGGYQYLFQNGWVAGNVLLGKIGPGSRAEELQTWYHRLLGFPEPGGWDSQIENGKLTNLDIEGYYRLLNAGKVDFWLSSRAAWGNYEQSVSFSPSVRMGKYQKVAHSHITGSRAGSQGGRETYVQLGADFKRMFWNATVQGADMSPSTSSSGMDPTKHVNRYFLNLVLAYPRLGFSYSFYYQTRETPESKGQLIGSLGFSYLF